MSYDRFPETKIIGYDHEVFNDEQAIYQELLKYKDLHCIVVDCYPGVDDEIFRLIKNIYQPEITIKSEDIFYDSKILNDKMKSNLTDDRVRGVMYYGVMEDFVDHDKLVETKKLLASKNKKILIYGVGAGLISTGGLYIYCDLARWEIQLRYRQGMPNFKCDNFDEDILKKVKRGYFIEWRISDKHKIKMFNSIDYIIDSNEKGHPKMITGLALREGLKQLVKQPFRLVPYFDPGVWGGQWMKEHCNLDPHEKNYAWSFDGVFEENSLYLRYNDTRIEIPAMDLVLYLPVELLRNEKLLSVWSGISN